MARVILIGTLIVLVNVLAGCNVADSGKSQLLPARMKVVAIIESSEADIIEQMAMNRQAYRRYLAALVAHYEQKGNNMKLGWAKNELKKLDKVPQYNYIIEAIVAGPELKATAQIAEAELIWRDAKTLEKQARALVIIAHEDKLRSALDKYNELIRKYPSSDRIDDAAFRAAGIFEHFKDYTIALLYYQRTYQWDPQTEYPARFKAASILDKHLFRKDEALKLYNQVLREAGLTANRKELVKKRIAALKKMAESEE